MIAAELGIPEARTRLGIIAGLGIFLIIVIAAMGTMSMTTPKKWKHKYKPQLYDTKMVAHIRAHIGKSVDPAAWVANQDRIKACLWLREAVAEYLELTWAGSPYDFNRMLSDPHMSGFLVDKPALRALLLDMQDLGVIRPGSALVMPKHEFVDLVDRIFKEVGAV